MTLVPTSQNTTPTKRRPFDYSALSGSLAAEARCRAKRINASKERHIIEVGTELAAMKAKLGHGQFTEWLDSELNFTPATARNYMRVAKEFADKPKTVFVLPPATLYRLAGATPEVRNEIVSRVEAGEHVNRDEVEAAIRRPKAAAEANRAAPALGRQEQPSEGSRQAAAARELVRCLSEHFTKAEILKMHAIWREADSGALQAALDGLPSIATPKEAPDAR